MSTLLDAPVVNLPVQRPTLIEAACQDVRHWGNRSGYNSHSVAEAVLSNNRHLITRWGGWRWLSPTIFHDTRTYTNATAYFQGLFDTFYSPNTGRFILAADYSLQEMLERKMLPYPDTTSPLWQSRTWEGESGKVRYASKHVVSIRNGQSVARAVLAEVKKDFGREGRLECADDLTWYLAAWEKFFERMGNVWAQERAKDSYNILLSTSPGDWASLGCVVNEGSCYGVEGGYEGSKYRLCQIPGAFVGFLVRHDDDQSVHSSIRDHVQANVLGRFWGIQAGNAVVLTNGYARRGTPYSIYDIYRIAQGVIHEAFGVPTLGQSKEDSDVLERLDAICYLNDSSVLLTPSGENPDLLARGIESALRNWTNYDDFAGDCRETCDRCGDRMECNTCTDCGAEVCGECSASCAECRDITCHACSAECVQCYSIVCPACSSECAECDRTVCTYHLTDDNLCDACESDRIERETAEVEENPKEDPEGDDSEVTSEPAISVSHRPWQDPTVASYLQQRYRTIGRIVNVNDWLWMQNRDSALHDLQADILVHPSRALLENALYSVWGDEMLASPGYAHSPTPTEIPF